MECDKSAVPLREERGEIPRGVTPAMPGLGMTDGRLRGGFRAKHALEARACEMNTNEPFAAGLRLGDMDDAAVRGKIRFCAPRSVIGERNADFEVGANGNIEARQKSSAA